MICYQLEMDGGCLYRCSCISKTGFWKNISNLYLTTVILVTVFSCGQCYTISLQNADYVAPYENKVPEFSDENMVLPYIASSSAENYRDTPRDNPKEVNLEALQELMDRLQRFDSLTMRKRAGCRRLRWCKACWEVMCKATRGAK